jgi:hypothetical protein
VDAILTRFPFPELDQPAPFANDVKPLKTPWSVELTAAYAQHIQLKRRLLRDEHTRCFQSLPGTEEAQWEVVERILEDMSERYPQNFSWERNGDECSFRNHLTNERHFFVWRDASALAYEPLDFVGRQVQEDLILLMQKDDELFLEAGQLCFPGNWSLRFKLGMTFSEIHQPIPRFHQTGVADRIKRFLLRMEPGQPWRRHNWSLTVGHHLHTAPETYHLWGRERLQVTEENAGERVHLRLEEQKLFRLPRSYGILFIIHTHLYPVQSMVRQRDRLIEFHRMIARLPEDLAVYKGVQPYRQPLLRYLEKQLSEGGG